VKTSDHACLVRGLTLHRREWLPDAAPCAAVAMVHGQGDAIDRYESSVARWFTDRGIACTGIDLPGHGQSPGRRGAVPAMAFAHATVRVSFEAAQQLAKGCPVGLFAHSMGGLLALDWLGDPANPRPDFLWLSSPLVDPRHRQPAWRVTTCRILARLLPHTTLSTGVRKADCREDTTGIATSPAVALLHSRVNFRWATELLAAGERLRETVPRPPRELPGLLTQGLADPVCPPENAPRLFEWLPCSEKHLVEIRDGRHETFDDKCREAVHAAADAWLGSLRGKFGIR
jgi:lysophospholipase